MVPRLCYSQKELAAGHSFCASAVHLLLLTISAVLIFSSAPAAGRLSGYLSASTVARRCGPNGGVGSGDSFPELPLCATASHQLTRVCPSRLRLRGGVGDDRDSSDMEGANMYAHRIH